MTKTVKTLIIINVALFIAMHLFAGFPWLSFFGLVPGFVFAKLRIWQLATYMFLHLGLAHLVVNMLMLWFFGPAIEAAWGRRQFLRFYFFSGIGAGLCSWLFAVRSFIPVIGASGAIFGLLVAYALVFPETVILLFFFFPMKIKHAVWVLAGINLLGAISQPNGGIAYFGHIGGALFGYLYLKYEWRLSKLTYWNSAQWKNWWRNKQANKRSLRQQKLDQKIDVILDKISKHGVGSLSHREKKLLELKSKR